METMTMKMTHSQKINFLLNQKISEHQLRLKHVDMNIDNYQGPQFFYNKIEKEDYNIYTEEYKQETRANYIKLLYIYKTHVLQKNCLLC